MRLVALGLLVLVYLWFWDAWFFWPAKIGVVALHELGHALMTWATGGSVVDWGLGLDQSGFVLSQGGNRFLVLNAGYLGSLLFGVLLMLACRRPEAVKGVRWQAAAWAGRAFGVFSVLYALFDIRDDVFFGSGRSDASMLAEHTGIPALVWGLGWLAAGVGVLWKLRRQLV